MLTELHGLLVSSTLFCAPKEATLSSYQSSAGMQIFPRANNDGMP